MSRITHPETEPSVSCGFYDSDGAAGSRKYYASQMSRIFDGIIRDGIFASIGTAFAVHAYSGNTVKVGTGKCWFNHTWTENDAVLPLDCGEAEQISDANRIDAVIIEVNSDPAVRDNCIKVKKGTPGTSPIKPTLTRSSTLNQYALCYIYRAAGSTKIIEDDITNAVGVETPFVSGMLEYVDPEEFCKQWVAKLNTFVASEKARTTREVDEFIDNNEKDFNKWYAEMKGFMADAVNEYNTWSSRQKATMIDWFENLMDQLSEDSAVNLQVQITDAEIRNALMYGFTDGQKTISEDGTVITSINSKNQKLVKTFTNNFLTITTVLTDSNNVEIGRYVKEISDDGNTINSTITPYPSTIRNGDSISY